MTEPRVAKSAQDDSSVVICPQRLGKGRCEVHIRGLEEWLPETCTTALNIELEEHLVALRAQPCFPGLRFKSTMIENCDGTFVGDRRPYQDRQKL